MYAVVANGIQAICHTQRKLERIIAVYPYPKFQKVYTEEEARAWIKQHSRKYNSLNYKDYGDTSTMGYAKVEYFISDDNIYYNVDTSKLGFIRIASNDESVKIDSRQSLIKVKICNVHLCDDLIPHHIIAIRRILKLLGEYIDVNIVVPDVSIFLAATKYTGSNYVIKGLQKEMQLRLGGVSFTIK